MRKRHPRILAQVAANPYPPGILSNLDRLGKEISADHIEPLPTSAPDHGAWAKWGGPYLHGSWLDAPFLWAESYFYRKILHAVDFFAAGPWFYVDPFQYLKRRSLRDARDLGWWSELQSTVAAAGDASGLRSLLTTSLWGNEHDLGFQSGEQQGESGESSPRLVADDCNTLLDWFRRSEDVRICIIADNAGLEIAADLVLARRLLQDIPDLTVEMHVKPHPYYVSDATVGDVLDCLNEFSSGATLSGVRADLYELIRTGRFMLRTHWFYCSPFAFDELPGDLLSIFASADLVIMKGDLNYRRLVGDRAWPPTTPFRNVVDYFPAPVAALRVLKSEVVVGLSPHLVTALDAIDPTWLVNGRHALVQVRF